MKGQVLALQMKGVNAVYISGGESEMDDQVAKELHKGQYQLAFFSSESLLTMEAWRDVFQSDVYQKNAVGFVVDEAHCVKKW